MSLLPPGDHDRDFEGVLRAHIREELREMHTSALGVIENIDRETMRAEVALKHDPGAYIDSVPIASPYTSATGGDLPPVDVGDEGIVLFLDAPLDGGLLADRGPIPETPHREHRVDDAIFLPAMVWYDSDAVPAHDTEAAERTVSHRGGSTLRMHDGEVSLTHPGGTATATRGGVSVTNDPYYTQRHDAAEQATTPPTWQHTHPHFRGTDPDSFDPTLVYDDHQLWPRAGDAAVTLDHHSGLHVMATSQGVGVVPDETDGDTHRGLVYGALTDPDRVHARTHRHEVRDPTAPVTVEDATATGDGTTTVTLSHPLGATPGHVTVTPRNPAARGVFHVASKTADDVTIEYDTARTDGDTLTYDLLVQPPRSADETVTLTTEPLGHREQVARLTDQTERQRVANRGTTDVQAARTRAENARAYIDYYTTGTTDPTDPALWPTIEHVPDTPEWLAWSDDSYDPATYDPPADTEPRGLDVDEPLDGN